MPMVNPYPMQATSGFMDNFNASRTAGIQREQMDAQKRLATLQTFEKMMSMYGPDMFKDPEAVKTYEAAIYPLRFPRDANGAPIIPVDFDRKMKQLHAEFAEGVLKRGEGRRTGTEKGGEDPASMAVVGGLTNPETLAYASGTPARQTAMQPYISGEAPNESVVVQFATSLRNTNPYLSAGEAMDMAREAVRRGATSPSQIQAPPAGGADAAIVAPGASALPPPRAAQGPTTEPPMPMSPAGVPDVTGRVLAQDGGIEPTQPKAAPTAGEYKVNIPPPRKDQTKQDRQAEIDAAIEEFKGRVKQDELKVRKEELTQKTKVDEAQIANLESVIRSRGWRDIEFGVTSPNKNIRAAAEEELRRRVAAPEEEGGLGGTIEERNALVDAFMERKFKPSGPSAKPSATAKPAPTEKPATPPAPSAPATAPGPTRSPEEAARDFMRRNPQFGRY